MTVIEKSDATAPLAQFADAIENGPVIITSGGQPVAMLLPLHNTDLETATLSTNAQFIELIERSRRQVATEGAISAVEMRQRFE